MNEGPLHILIVDNDPASRCLFHVARAELGSLQCELAHADRLDEALSHGKENPYDAILVDFLPSTAVVLKTLTQLRARLPGVPIVLLTEDDQVTRARVGGAVEPPNAFGRLGRAIRYAVERYRLQGRLLPRLAFLDDLTELYNRRGFFLLAEQQMRQARRTKRGLLLLYVDLDGLKQINDTFGHREGDVALTRAAEVLRTTFRASDVIGRLGGDEFGVLAWEDSDQSAEAVVTRLLQQVEVSNAGNSGRHVLSLSFGLARFNPVQMSSLEALMAEADEALYRQKRGRQRPRLPPGQATSRVPVRWENQPGRN